MTCQHHYMIQPANGPVSVGTCKLCHETREFQNGTPTKKDGTEKIVETKEVIAGRKRAKLESIGMPYPVET